jgi:hypothetical protein
VPLLGRRPSGGRPLGARQGGQRRPHLCGGPKGDEQPSRAGPRGASQSRAGPRGAGLSRDGPGSRRYRPLRAHQRGAAAAGSAR